MPTEGVILVTGGTRGIGFGISKVLASKGYNLILGYNSNKEAAIKSKRTLINKYCIKVEIIGGDSFDVDNTINSYLNVIQNTFNNKLIGIIHNAGGYPGLSTKSVFNKTIKSEFPGHIKTQNDYKWIDYYVKIYGLMFMKLLEKCASLMEWRKNIGGGRFIFISAPGCNSSQPAQPGYVMPGVGKSFGEYLVRQYAKVYADKNITVNCIIPGAIKTNAWISYKNPNIDKNINDVEELRAFKRYIEKTPMNRYALPSEVGHLVAYLVSNEALFLTGVAIPFDGGIHLGRKARPML